MKILFFLFQYKPTPDANGNCVEKLRSSLYQLNVSTDVLSFGTKGTSEDAYGKLYTAHTWAQYMNTGKSAHLSPWRVLLRLPLAAVTRALHRIVGKPQERQEKCFSPNACLSIKHALEKLCRTQQYDWVIAVSSPHCIHEIAAGAKLGKAKLALYYFDPYSTHQLLSSRWQQRRFAEECQAAQKADIIFASLEHENDWKTTQLSQSIQKVHFLPYPNLTRYEAQQPSPPLVYEPNCVRLLYIGTLEDRIRYPQAMLKLFQAMSLLDDTLRLYLIGVQHGETVQKQLRDSKETLREKLTLLPPVPAQTAMAYISNADIVINLGNCMTNQMPSKLLDYIAAGKPILNISSHSPCNTLSYLKRYPWFMQCYKNELASQAEIECKAAQALRFINEYKGRSMDWESVQTCMKGFTSTDVASQLLQCLTHKDLSPKERK